jgi:hypothetical protein
MELGSVRNRPFTGAARCCPRAVRCVLIGDREMRSRGRRSSAGATSLSSGSEEPTLSSSVFARPAATTSRSSIHDRSSLTRTRISGTRPQSEARRQRRHGVMHVLELRLVTGKRGARGGALASSPRCSSLPGAPWSNARTPAKHHGLALQAHLAPLPWGHAKPGAVACGLALWFEARHGLRAHPLESYEPERAREF